MTHSNADGCLPILAAVFGMLAVGVMAYALGRYEEAHYWESKMIEMGIAEWHADPKTGVRGLKYKVEEAAE